MSATREVSRRRMLQAVSVAAAAAATATSARESEAAKPDFVRMPEEGKDTPKICLGGVPDADEAAMRRVKQVGVDHVLGGGPRIPWTEAELQARMDRYKAAGIKLCNLMISGFNDVIWGRPGADEQIENVITSIRVAGKVGLPVVEYNFYAHRLIEGYKEETGPRRRRLHRLRLRASRKTCRRSKASARTRGRSS